MPTKKNEPKKSEFILPPDAKHFDREDAALAPMAMFGNMTQDQTQKATLLIVQPMSRMDDARQNIGKIFNTRSGKFLDSVEIMVIVAPGANDVPRAMKQKKFKNGKEVYDYNAPIVCSSPNGVYPYEGYAGAKVKDMGPDVDGEVLPDECGQCIFNSLYLCTPYYRYYALLVNKDATMIPVAYRAKGVAMGNARKFNTALQDLESAGQYWSFRMASEEQISRSGNPVYVPTFEPLRQIKDRDLLGYVMKLNADYRAKQERILASSNSRVLEIQNDLRD